METYDGKGIDWFRFYSERIARAKKSGSKVTGMCPFHENTKTTAFWASLDSGMWKCEAGCGQGNPTTFLARIDDVTNAEANNALLDLAGVVRDAPPRRRAATPPAPQQPYTVQAYAEEKHIEPSLLAAWGLTAKSDTIRIPYLPGEAVRFRRRPGSAKRFAWLTKKGTDGRFTMVGEMTLYGLFLPSFGGSETEETVVLVEGESDCHALWSLGIAALGVPGASSFRSEWVKALGSRRVLLHSEGDAGATTFIERTSTILMAAGVECAVWSTPEAKDPSDLFRDRAAAAGDILRGAMALAVPCVPMLAGATVAAAGLLGSRGLRCPRGWVCSDDGITLFDEDTERERRVTSTPVVLSRRVRDSSTGEERIGVAFLRDKVWHETTADRDELFSTRAIVALLAPLGMQITSENARDVVRWLGALEQSNMDVLPHVRGSRALGWCGTDFLPTNPGDVLLDLDGGSEELVGAFKQQGTLEEWKDAMCAQRSDSAVFRFMLAASLAAPLLRACKGRNFFVYNWGSSKGGKTAALKAAMSVWGDPEILMTTFNSTSVGLERMAGFMRDLPLAIDERQAANGDQRKLDNDVYSLASGTGRVRGARDGGLQATAHFRTVVLSTGEEPLSGSVSKTGVSTRVLELFGSPFLCEDDAANMHRVCAEHFGHVGPLFIKKLVEFGEENAWALQDALKDRIESYGAKHASSHVSGIATVLAADTLLSMWLWGAERLVAMREAEVLGIAVLGMVEVASAGDVDESALLWVEDWLSINGSHFTSTSHNGVWGERRSDDTVLVFPTPLREGLEAAGFSYAKTMKALHRAGAVVRSDEGKPSTTHRVYGATKRVVWLDVTKLGAGARIEETVEF